MAGRLGELLVRENLISLQQLQKAQDEQKKAGGRIGYHLTKLGFIEESELTNFLSKQYGVPSINLKEFDIDGEVVKLVPKEVAEKHQCIPVNRAGASLILAMSDPSNIYAIDDIKFLTGYNIEVVVASEQAIKEALEKYYAEKGPSYDEVMEGFDENEIAVDHDEGGITDISDLEKSAADAPVVKLVNLILLDAIKKGASDIHVEPYEKDFRVRYRVDGVLYEVMKPPMKLKMAIISRLKIMAELDIAERRLPQDGRIKLKLGKGREMDFRVSCCPTLFGEKVVMRLLDKSNLQLDMTKLGFDVEPLRMFKEAIDRPYGMVLVTSAVNLILAQRLARKLCQECKKQVQVPPQALTDIGVQPDEIGTFEVFEPAGCRTCNDRGYKGRVALYEVMPLWDSVKELVINGASTAELKNEAIRLGMQTLRMAGIAKLKSGMTSIEEIVGNTAPDTTR